ncbi:MAG: 2-oxoglutarate dehydrogenase E1 component [Syntrophobacter sp.]
MNLSLSLNAEFIDSQYRKWKEDPQGLGREWQAFFEGFELSSSAARTDAGFCEKGELLKQAYVQELIYRYRDLGHLLSCLDPLAQCPTSHPLLDLSAFGLSESDLEGRFFAPRTLFAEEQASLKEILSALRETYCHSVGVEYMHLQDPSERLWLQEHIEPARNRARLSEGEKKRILDKLCQANLFEQFIHLRYVGQKRFSVEGAEVIVPMMDALVQHAYSAGCREILFGTAHRGRLNIQVNVLNKPYEWIFCEFEDHYDPNSIYGAGDVKYHRGFMADVAMEDGNVRLFLANNPSHLEAVNPVLEGIAYARQQQAGGAGRRLVLPVLIHGDAAFSGQGVVAETLNLSQLEGYHTGGTVHIIVNNQIGFTTLPEHARSTRYATDVAKMLMVPIFHVHGEDPEAVVHVVKLAIDYRAQFNKDIVVDVVCYRRYGHNEGDEPYYTQPRMYERIKDRPPLHVLYARSLREAGVIGEGDPERIAEGIEQCLESAYKAAHDKTCSMPEDRFYETWEGIDGRFSHEPVKTGVEEAVLLDIARKLNVFPDGFSVHPRLERILKRRLETVGAGTGIDWATAEALAFGTLLLEGTPVRLSGQDCGRGTFSQRHSVLSDITTGEHFVPLNQLASGQAPFTVFDSMLSENAVLGFEYGISLVSPRSLVLWEAQFGDFANNAQALFDQFISSAQYKWQRLSGLVVLLPHGFEGQGPEHSSARIERFLQLCAQENMEVCYPSTPAQYFHLLRRQMKRGFRKPLIVFTPKSLLRHPAAVSATAELASGRFEEVLSRDPGFENASRLLLCSGRVYYELLARREKTAASDTAIIRVEQFYPMHEARLREAVSGFPSAKRFFWVQEEPRNMGAWEFIRPRLGDIIGVEPGYIGRPAAASPASGFPASHRQEQEAFLGMAFPGQEASQEKL